jgi:hypothetical protein
MEIESTLLVNKAIASGLKSNPAHVAECVREAEATMNTKALERHRIVSSTPRLHDVKGSALGNDLIELTFRAPTRSI